MWGWWSQGNNDTIVIIIIVSVKNASNVGEIIINNNQIILCTHLTHITIRGGPTSVHESLQVLVHWRWVLSHDRNNINALNL